MKWGVGGFAWCEGGCRMMRGVLRDARGAAWCVRYRVGHEVQRGAWGAMWCVGCNVVHGVQRGAREVPHGAREVPHGAWGCAGVRNHKVRGCVELWE